ncbi:MAG: TOBE-like domain-containing protein [Chloroflexota bacterium]|nr:TOBE-like domain-containing protein [Chloroflexota bacterium]
MGIAVRQLSKDFGAFKALDNVSVEIPDGSLTALLGPSGSGKSTLLRVIAGLEKPDSGEVTIGGEVATGLPPQRRNVGFVFQHYAAFKHMTVRDNVGFGLRIRKRPKAEIRARVDELLHLVQLDGFAGRYPAQLSGGQRQRMALARALAVEPRVLLLDEPFGALDARVREELRDWLRRLHDQVHVTTVLVTHDQEEAMEVASNIVVMNHGRIEQIGTPAELYSVPATEFVMGFVGKVNRLGDAYIRPHEVVICAAGTPDCEPATVTRVLSLGFETRVELTVPDGRRMWAQLTTPEAERLGLTAGQPVGVDLSRGRTIGWQSSGRKSAPFPVRRLDEPRSIARDA